MDQSLVAQDLNRLLHLLQVLLLLQMDQFFQHLIAGLLGIDGLGGSIETVAQPLKLQPNAAANIELENKHVVIATNGDITTTGVIKADKINIDTTDTAAASVGQGTISAGTTNVT